MNKSDRDLYDGLIAQTGTAFRRFFECVDVSGQPEAEHALNVLRAYAGSVDLLGTVHGIEQPEWIVHIASVVRSDDDERGLMQRALESAPEAKRKPDSKESESLETKTVAAVMSHDDWFMHALKHRGGTGSTQEIFETQNELAGPDEKMKKRQIRHIAMKLYKRDGLLEKETPGPGTLNNYWRLPNVSPRPITVPKPKRTEERHRNNGHASVPQKPIPEGYKVNDKLRDKILFIVFFVLRCFTVKTNIVELINDYEPERYSYLTIKQEITNMTRDNLFVKRVFASDHTYGNPEWPNYEEDGTILSIPNEYRPKGHRLPELDLR